MTPLNPLSNTTALRLYIGTWVYRYTRFGFALEFLNLHAMLRPYTLHTPSALPLHSISFVSMLSIWSTFKLQPGQVSCSVAQLLSCSGARWTHLSHSSLTRPTQFFCLFDNSRTSVLVFVFTFGFGPPLGLAGYFYVKVLSPISDTLARASTPTPPSHRSPPSLPLPQPHPYFLPRPALALPQVFLVLRSSSNVDRASWSTSQQFQSTVAAKMIYFYLFLLACWTPAMVQTIGQAKFGKYGPLVSSEDAWPYMLAGSLGALFNSSMNPLFVLIILPGLRKELVRRVTKRLGSLGGGSTSSSIPNNSNNSVISRWRRRGSGSLGSPSGGGGGGGAAPEISETESPFQSAAWTRPEVDSPSEHEQNGGSTVGPLRKNTAGKRRTPSNHKGTRASSATSGRSTFEAQSSGTLGRPSSFSRDSSYFAHGATNGTGPRSTLTREGTGNTEGAVLPTAPSRDSSVEMPNSRPSRTSEAACVGQSGGRGPTAAATARQSDHQGHEGRSEGS